MRSPAPSPKPARSLARLARGCSILLVLVANSTASAGPSCTITVPSPGATVWGWDYRVEFDVDHTTPGTPVTAHFVWSNDGGYTWQIATAAPPYSNPIFGVPTPSTSQVWSWDVLGSYIGCLPPYPCDIVLILQVNDGTASSSCQVQVWVEIRPICTLTQSAPSPVRSPVTLDLTVDNVVTWPPDATFEYTADGGLTWTQALPTAASTNPMTLPPMPPPFMFEWDSLGQAIGVIAPATGIEMRATITSGPLSNTCETAPFDVDNTVACSLTVLSPSPVTDQVDVEVQPDSPSSPVVDITFDYSVDGGATWLPASPAGGHTNPVLGAAVMTPTSWSWDSRGDGVGVASLQAGVLLRASLEDAVVIAPSTCESPPFEVDNTSLCPGDCGDCDESGSPSITVLDALVAAQISAGVVLASPAQEGCCDVNDSLSITVIDALLMAQTGVGLTVTLGCP